MTCPELYLFMKCGLFPPALHNSPLTAIPFLLLSKHVMHVFVLVQCSDIFVAL